MFYFNPFNCLLKNLDTECRPPRPPADVVQYLHRPLTPPPSLSFLHRFFPPPLFFPLCNNFSGRARKKQHSLQKCNGSAPLRQVGQPNRAMRQDIHHYVIGWSKWPWCSLHTQFQIPLGSIMGKFKQRKHGRPSHLILMILDVIRVWCSEREKE